MTTIKCETLQFPTNELRETFLTYQRKSNWRKVLRSIDGVTVRIEGITVVQMAAALDDTYNAIKL